MSFKIIYIDDELGLCQVFEDSFSLLEDVEIKTFVDPELGLQEIDLVDPDLIILDYRLPNMTGEELAQRIKKSCPVVLITGDLHAELEFPFVRLFPKPFKFLEMEEFILQCRDRKLRP